MNDAAEAPFDLAAGPLIRVDLIRTAPPTTTCC